MIGSYVGEFLIFQQENAPAHRSYDAVEMLRLNTPAFTPPTLRPPGRRIVQGSILKQDRPDGACF